jgi:hypothetical protein
MLTDIVETDRNCSHENMKRTDKMSPPNSVSGLNFNKIK